MRTALVLFLVALGVLAAFANKRLKIHSDDNHFVYLADAFLHGQVELTRTPHHQNDWASYEILQLKGASAEAHGEVVKGFFTRRAGKPDQFQLLSGQSIDIPRRDRGPSEKKYYVSFPPMPAVLMMPAVAAVGYGANDVVFTILFAALNVALMWLLLQRLSADGRSERTPRDNLWLTILFGFGSAHLWCSVLGQVWFTALVVGVTFNLLYIYFAVDARRPFLAGLCLAAAFATRASLVFAAVFFYLQLLLRPGDRNDKLRRFALFSLPCLVVGLALMYYNFIRFERFGEFGHTYLYGGTIPRIRDFGLFDQAFLNRNLHAAFTLVPRLTEQAPYLQISKHGMSILLTTPALLWLLWPRRSSALARVTGLTAAVIAVPILFYQNTGWQQFGYRFILDYLPYLVVCLALGGRPLGRAFKALVLAGVLVNSIGAGTFQRYGKLYAEFMCEEPRR